MSPLLLLEEPLCFLVLAFSPLQTEERIELEENLVTLSPIEGCAISSFTMSILPPLGGAESNSI
jgi:hypothetical protein